MDNLANTRTRQHGLTAREAGLIACTTCGRLDRAGRVCARCGATLSSRYPDSIQRTLAWLAAVSFALSVIFTMLAAQSLDPRLIWDSIEEGPSDE